MGQFSVKISAPEGQFSVELNTLQAIITPRAAEQLEDRLGVRLLERKKRALVELTEAGKLFALEARRVIEQVERAETVGKGRGAESLVTLRSATSRRRRFQV